METYRLRKSLAKLQNIVNSYTGRRKEQFNLFMPTVETYNKKILEKWENAGEDLHKKSLESFNFDECEKIMKEKGLPDYESLSPEFQKRIRDSFDSSYVERKYILKNELKKIQENLKLRVEIILLKQVIEGVEFKILQEDNMDVTLRTVAKELSKIPQEKLFDAVTEEVKKYTSPTNQSKKKRVETTSFSGTV